MNAAAAEFGQGAGAIDRGNASVHAEVRASGRNAIDKRQEANRKLAVAKAGSRFQKVGGDRDLLGKALADGTGPEIGLLRADAPDFQSSVFSRRIAMTRQREK